jgi:hypothetical protein
VLLPLRPVTTPIKSRYRYETASGTIFINFVDPTGRKSFGLLNSDPNFVRPEVESFGDFLDIMFTDLPYAAYKGVTGIPSQVSQRGLEMRAEAFDSMESGGAISPTGPSTYLAGWAFQVGGAIGDVIASSPEAAVNITGHIINSASGDARAELINQMVRQETSVFFGDIVPAMASNAGTTAYSILSGDPMPFGISVSYESSQFQAHANYNGSSGSLTQAATGILGGGISASSQAYQLATGAWTPKSGVMPALSILSGYSSLVDLNGSIVDQIVANTGLSPNALNQGANFISDPTGKHVKGGQ